jgi:4'-phosphopantetheinyl transferase
MTSPRRIDAPAPFELWSADLDASAVTSDCLSDDERARAGRFVFERDARRFVAARALLRGLLADYLGAVPADLRFDVLEYGKPVLRVPHAALAFNLSHSENVAWFAFTDASAIGVDVERLRPIDDAHELAQRNYTPSECEQLAQTPPVDRDLAFLRCWTRKEACLKAIGSGFSIPPETFEAGADAAPRLVSIDTPQGTATLQLCSVAPPEDPQVIGALARVV